MLKKAWCDSKLAKKVLCLCVCVSVCDTLREGTLNCFRIWTHKCFLRDLALQLLQNLFLQQKKSKVSSNLLKRIKQLSQSIIHNFWEWDNFKRQYCFAVPKCGEWQNEVKVLIYWLTPKERNEFFLKKTDPMHMVSAFLCSHICSKAENSCFEENSFHCNPICFFLIVNMLLEFSVAVWWKLRLHFRVRTPSATADSNGSFLTSYDNLEEKSGNEEVWKLLVSTFGYSPPFQDCFTFFCWLIPAGTFRETLIHTEAFKNVLETCLSAYLLWEGSLLYVMVIQCFQHFCV